MILTLALRELRKSWGALLQGASLAVAVAALVASFQLSSQVSTHPVAGSACAEDILALSWVSDTGQAQDAFSPRQAQALSDAIAGALSSQVLLETAEVMVHGEPRQVGVAYVEPQYFQALCVPRTDVFGAVVDAPFVDGMVVEATAARGWDRPWAIVQSRRHDATSQAMQFTGVDPLQPVRAWVPMRLAKARGAAYLDAGAPMVKIVVRLRENETLGALQGRLEHARKTQATLFAGVERIEVGPPMQVSAQMAMKIGQMSLVLRIFCGALLALVVLNLATYHLGRMGKAQDLATTLAALGVPPRAIAYYASIEPIAVGLVAWVGGVLMGWPLARAAMTVASLEGTVEPNSSGVGVALGVVAVVSAAITVVRIRVLRRRGAPSKGKSQRLLLRLLPVLLGFQVALGASALIVAAQACAGLWRALPPPPHFPLPGLSVVEVERADMETVERNVSLRWAAAWGTHGRAGWQAALSTTHSPFVPNTGFLGTIHSGERSVVVGFGYTTPNFFQVLGTRGIDAAVFADAPDPFDPASRDKANHVVLNALAEAALFPQGGTEGTVVRYTHQSGRVDPQRMRSSVVLGTLDDGVVGTRGASGVQAVDKLAMQAALPTAYQPMVTVDVTMPLMVFVRHPVDASSTQVAAGVLPAVQAVFPGARVARTRSAQELFEEPLRRERALALILGLLAGAILGTSVLGMLSLSSLLLAALRVEVAMRVAVGARRRQAAWVLLGKLMVPVMLGLVGAVLPAIAGLMALGAMLETAQRAGVLGPVLAAGALLACFGGLGVAMSRAIINANMMEWLRRE